MRKKMLAVVAAIASLMLAGSAIGTADASPQVERKVAYFKTKLTPSAGVKPGTTINVAGTGAKPSTSYYCVLAVYKTSGGANSAILRSTLKTVKSNPKGKISCKVTYKPFSAKDAKGVTRHCPTTAADRKAKFACGVALADVATVGALSASAASFTPRK